MIRYLCLSITCFLGSQTGNNSQCFTNFSIPGSRKQDLANDFWYWTGFTGFWGFLFLSPFPDERVKTNPPTVEKGLVLAQLLSEVFPKPMSKPDFRPGPGSY
ncbi:MAG: hypothetical protein AVO38_15895 [delta proteobacterium ML8_D]|nr:MAG: hypothetical protein AVO38_15895 [delta proteobacterium ML8_D]